MSWNTGINAITLLVDDLETAAAFYESVFEVSCVYSDDDSAVSAFENTSINLLRQVAAAELLEPAPVPPTAAGSRAVFTVQVDDVEATCELLAGRGVSRRKRPARSSLGVRTASFRDPGGHLWELAHELAVEP